jgi:thiamine pyrophosphokinase
MPGTALIVAGGARPDPQVVNALPPADFVVAADGGADHALGIGLPIDCLVGDLDSISVDGLKRIHEAEIEIREFQARKAETDLELALSRAMEEQPDRLVVIGIGGGRLDHQLANYTVLSSDRFHTALVEGLVGSARLTVVRGAVQLAGALGETISLIPIRGLAEGVTTDGLEYQLNDEPLYAGSARGVSNRFVAERATVSVARGVVLAVQPFALRERSGR